MKKNGEQIPVIRLSLGANEYLRMVGAKLEQALLEVEIETKDLLKIYIYWKIRV
jgi:hypothetical protein